MTIPGTPFSTQLKVGIFTILILLLIGAVTIWVNHKPYWWRPCQLVHIKIDDATGLKMKSPIRSLGLQIGYLKTIELSETHVRLGICITAEVEVLPSTRAYIRGEGFLGDKFVELKPIKYIGSPTGNESKPASPAGPQTFQWIPSAHAEEPVTVEPLTSPTPVKPSVPGPSQPTHKQGKEIPVGERSSEDVQHLVRQVDGLVNEMTALTNNLKDAIRPEELRSTLSRLNQTLENASRTLSPEGGLNTTAQRTLEKLEDAIEQLRDQVTRINQGQGSVGMVLNDPSYAEELRAALKNLNYLLGRATSMRFVLDMGAEQISAYHGGRGWFRLGIWPENDRYYLLGISSDSRGKRSVTTTTTTTGLTSSTTETVTVEPNAIVFTGMLGKVFLRRFDFSIGVLHNDGTASVSVWLGPSEAEEMIIVRNDLYSRGQGIGPDDRVSLTVRPFIYSPTLKGIYFRTGLDTLAKTSGSTAFFWGAGITFDDQDIKLLFTLR